MAEARSLWIGARLVTMRFFWRTHIGNPMTWSVWSAMGFFLQNLNFSRPEVSSGFERIGPTAQATKSLFPLWIVLHHLFAITTYISPHTLVWWHWRDILVLCLTFLYFWSSTVVRDILSTVHRHTRKMLPLAVLAWEAFQRLLWLHSVASEEEQKLNKVFNGEELDINLRCHQVYPW